MSWIDLLDNSHFLGTLFPKEAPSLSDIRVHRIQLHQDGPVLLLDFDLNHYPASPPAKWLADSFNTVKLRLMGIEIRHVAMTGWSASNVGRLEFAQNAESTTIKFRAPECSLDAELLCIRVDGVSAYHNQIE